MVALLVLFLGSFASALWPQPSSQSLGSQIVWIDRSVAITYNAPSNSCIFTIANATAAQDNSVGSNQIVQTAVQNAYRTLFQRNYVPWKFHPRNSNFEPDYSASSVQLKHVTLRQSSVDPEGIAKPVDGSIDESYKMTLGTDGNAVLTAATAVGLAHALTTFTQLFFAHSRQGVYTPYAPATISDSPKFPHRGLNMDVSRNFYPVPSILRTIDGLAYNKMNRLHMHITDAQSWPLELPTMPEVATNGRYSPGLTYSPADLAGIQRYGSLRGVEVYLEIDMPGHTSSIFYSHPDLIASFNIQPDWVDYAAEPPSGTLKLNSSAVYSFLDRLWDDILPRVSPWTAYFHTGGDEVNFNAYKNDDTVRSSDPVVLHPLLQTFVDRAHQRVRDAGLTPIAWEETLLDYNLTLGSDVVVQAWRNSESAQKIVAQGHKALVGDYTYWYLDCGKGQWLNFEPGSASEQFWPYLDYCAPYHNWRDVYSYDPLNGIPAESQHLIMGGECHIWSEQTDPTNLDTMLWPRTAAVAEILWSGAKDANGQNRSQIDAAPRLSDMRERLVAGGIRADTIQMPFCLQNNGSQVNQCGYWNFF